MPNQRWKALERQWAEVLVNYNMEAHRITRADNYAKSDFDVLTEEAPWLKSDCKYSVQKWRSNTLLDTIRKKYCKDKGDQPVLLCKSKGEHGLKATVDGEFLAGLLAVFLGKMTREQVEGVWHGCQ